MAAVTKAQGLGHVSGGECSERLASGAFRGNSIGVGLVDRFVSAGRTGVRFVVVLGVFPITILFPPVRQIDDGARLGNRCERIETVADNGTLIFLIEGAAYRMSQRIIGEYGAWRLRRLENVASATENDGTEARGFQVSCYQTPGLMAHGSHRDQ